MNFVQRSLLAVTMAGVVSSVQAEEYSAIRAQLKQIVPNAPEASIKPSVITGLYEVSVGTMVIYMSEDGKFAFNGNLIDLDTRENLTDKAKSEIRKEAMSKISVDSMIVYPAKDKEKHVMTVFSDVDCPYCHKLHNEIPVLNEAGITVRYLAFPRSGVGSPAYQKWVSAWCAEDPAKAMDKAMKGQPLATKKCDHPVDEHMQHARFFGVNGTPNIILDSGKMLPGYVPANELIQIFNRE